MAKFEKLAASLTGLAAIAAFSSSAAAQTNPYNYGNNSNVVGAIVNAVMGYGQYPQGNYGYEQMARRGSVEMCARTAEQRLNSDRRYAGYNNRFGQTRYNNGYAQNGNPDAGVFRVVGITNIKHRMNGTLSVRGIASSNAGANGYGYGNNGYRTGGMDYRFTCKMDSRGAVTSLNFDRGMRTRRG
jgi:hypothetical protein